MAVYVDALMHHGWKLRGRITKSCHMFVGRDDDLEELHEMASKIGLKRAWFQNKKRLPHYDLTPSRRRLAVKHGAIECDRRTVCENMRDDRIRRYLEKD